MIWPKINFADQSWTLEMVSSKIFDEQGNELDGQVDYEARKILISTTPEHGTLCTLLEEIAHVIGHEIGHDNSVDGTHELVGLYSSALSWFIQSNPALLRAILRHIK